MENTLNPEKFYAVRLEPPIVARLHNVDPRTVREYIKLGLIEKHPDSNEHRAYIRGSVALTLDFTELRREACLRRKAAPC